MNRRSFLKPPADRRGERRAAFLRAAAQVFGAKGYHEASMAEIAEAADLGTGTAYLYFDSKEELYAALLTEKVEELSDVVRRRIEKVPNVWAAIRAAVLAQLEYYEQNRAFFQSFVRERLEMQARVKRESWERVGRSYEQFLQMLAQLMESGQRQGVIREADSRQLALALSGVVNQLTRDALRRPAGQPLAGLADFVVNLFRGGAQTKAVVSNHELAVSH